MASLKAVQGLENKLNLKLDYNVIQGKVEYIQ